MQGCRLLIGLATLVGAGLLGGCGPIHSSKYLNGQPVSAEKVSHQTLQKRIKVLPEQRGVLIVLPSDYLFEPNSAHFLPDYQQTMHEVVSVMKEHRNQTISISGHTDNIGARQQQQRITRDQAETVAAYLWAQGVAPWTALHIQGRGKTQTIASNSNLAGSTLNRRVEIRLRPNDEG